MSTIVDAPQFWQLQALKHEVFVRAEKHVVLYDDKKGATFLVQANGSTWKVNKTPLREIDLRTIYDNQNFVEVRFTQGIHGFDGIFRLIIYPHDKLNTRLSYDRAKEISSSWK